jgi:hypothetical protein
MKTKSPAQIIGSIVSRTKHALAKFPNLSSKQIAEALHRTRNYDRALARLANKGTILLEKTALQSFDAHFCAAVRAAERAGLTAATYSELKEIADRSRAGDAAAEAVSARWIGKDNGDFRLIVKGGVLRNTRLLVFRDALSCLGIDSQYDYSRPGAGGEKAFMRAVVNAICSGWSWIASADFKHCFASMRPAHFAGGPLNQQLLSKEVFISEEAKVEVKIPDNAAKLWTFLQSKQGGVVTTSIKDYIICCTTQMVRQGLPEGLLLSPLLARSFIGREIQATLGSMGVAVPTYVDDLAICACAQPTAAAAMQTLEVRLKSHPAGPIELHSKCVKDAAAWKMKGHVEVLKYLLEPDNGYGDNPVHVKPGQRRIERFKKRLKEKLDQAKAEGEDLYTAGLRYWKRWYASQQAWTKVPFFSELASEMAATDYIHDYIICLPMGSNAKVSGLAA